LTLVAFVVGALASVISGFVGMRIAVFANSRVAVKAVEGRIQRAATIARSMLIGFLNHGL